MNIKDKTIPLGTRKASFVKWMIGKGVSLDKAKLICHRKFYHETENEAKREHSRSLQYAEDNGVCPRCGSELDGCVQIYDRGYKVGVECTCCK